MNLCSWSKLPKPRFYVAWNVKSTRVKIAISMRDMISSADFPAREVDYSGAGAATVNSTFDVFPASTRTIFPLSRIFLRTNQLRAPDTKGGCF